MFIDALDAIDTYNATLRLSSGTRDLCAQNDAGRQGHRFLYSIVLSSY